MNINKLFSHFITLGAVIASLGIVPQAFAVDPSHLVQEGNSRCSDYANNKTINEISVGSPDTTATAESPVTVDDGDVQVTYWFDNGILEFNDAQTTASPSTPEGINIVILRGDQNKAETYIWGSGQGVTRWPPVTGTDVDLSVTAPQTTIESISFCYGLGTAEEVSITMPACGGPDLASGLTTGLTSHPSGSGFPYDECERDVNGTPTSDFECDIVAGELTCCSCYGSLEGCVLGDPDCQVEFSDFDGSWVGSGSPSRYCERRGSGYICYYRNP